MQFQVPRAVVLSTKVPGLRSNKFWREKLYILQMELDHRKIVLDLAQILIALKMSIKLCKVRGDHLMQV